MYMGHSDFRMNTEYLAVKVLINFLVFCHVLHNFISDGYTFADLLAIEERMRTVKHKILVL